MHKKASLLSCAAILLGIILYLILLRINSQFPALKKPNERWKLSNNRTLTIPEKRRIVDKRYQHTNECNITHLTFLKQQRLVKHVDCVKIVKAYKEEIKNANDLSAWLAQETIKPEEYMKMTKVCLRFIEMRGYITNCVTKLEKDYPVAFGILMYKDVEQVERLLRAIYRPQNLYCIHVDKKSNFTIYEAMRSIAGCFDNVFMATERISVTWGTYSVLEADLRCMRDLWNSNRKWKYFINLTGQEFPLRTNYELVEILKSLNGANSIRQGKILWKDRQRWLGAGDPPHGIQPSKGPIHIVATRGFVDFVLHDKRAQDFLQWTKKTKIPDETYYSTLNSNPFLQVPGSLQITSNKSQSESNSTNQTYIARFKVWSHTATPCHGMYIRDICIFGTGDVRLLSTRKELFANKFHLDYQHFGLDCMEEFHRNRTVEQYNCLLKTNSSKMLC